MFAGEWIWEIKPIFSIAFMQIQLNGIIFSFGGVIPNHMLKCSFHLVISGHAKCSCWSRAIQVRFPLMHRIKTSLVQTRNLLKWNMLRAKILTIINWNIMDTIPTKATNYYSLLCIGYGEDVTVDCLVQHVARKVLSDKYSSYLRWYARPAA